jgi:hypothetical protein
VELTLLCVLTRLGYPFFTSGTKRGSDNIILKGARIIEASLCGARNNDSYDVRGGTRSEEWLGQCCRHAVWRPCLQTRLGIGKLLWGSDLHHSYTGSDIRAICS